MESLTPSAAYASPTAKPAATNAVVPRRAFFICLSLVLVQADASTGPPETHRPSERPKIRNSPNRTAAKLAPSYGEKSTGIGKGVKTKSPGCLLFSPPVAKMPQRVVADIAA